MKKLREADLWNLMRQQLPGQSVSTLVQKRPNKVDRVTDSEVVILGRQSRPTRRQIWWAYDQLWQKRELGLDPALKQKRVAAIVIALLKHVLPDQVAQVSGMARIRLTCP